MLLQELAGQKLGRICVVGVGNRHRGDDGAGLLIARLLRRGLGQSGAGCLLVACMEAGTTPELYSRAIAATAPDTVLLIDAVHFGALPGEWLLLSADDMEERSAWQSHRPPLALFMRYLAQRAGARVWLLGIQAGETAWGARLTPAVANGARNLVAELSRLFAGE